MRHKWFENSRVPDRTVRICERCGLIKVSRHEFEGGRPLHWIEFYRGSERVPGDGTPPCEPEQKEAHDDAAD